MIKALLISLMGLYLIASSTLSLAQDSRQTQLNEYHGLYYSRDYFEQFQLQEITHWYQLIDACKQYSLNGKALFYLDLRDNEAIASWFDFLNIRLNGALFHTSILRGESSFKSRNIQKVFEFWEEAIDAQCFSFYEHVNPNQKIVYPDWSSYISGAGTKFMSSSSLKQSLIFLPLPLITTRLKVNSESLPIDNLKTSEETAFINGSLPEMIKPSLAIIVMFLKRELRVDEVQYTLEQYRRHFYDL
jgi:hypothetical protein